MGFYYQDSLADIVRLASERVITYNECADMLEDALKNKYPWAHLSVELAALRAYCRPQQYCWELLQIERNIVHTIEERCVG